MSTASTPTSAPAFSIATWNVNSLRIRHERLLAWLDAHKPDVLCLQELKMQEQDYPSLEFQNVGYHSVVLGQKTYNGVAILWRKEHGPAAAVQTGMSDGDPDNEARLIAATLPGLGVRVMSVYVPNGQSIDSDKYVYKLRFLERLHAYLSRSEKADAPLLICGDYNIAPADLDCYDPPGWVDTVICHVKVREAWAKLLGYGLHDTLRLMQPDTKVYTYWDYRQLAFPKNQGLRIDHVLCTTPLKERCIEAVADRNARKGEKPSDHVPLIVKFRAA